MQSVNLGASMLLQLNKTSPESHGMVREGSKFVSRNVNFDMMRFVVEKIVVEERDFFVKLAKFLNFNIKV